MRTSEENNWKNVRECPIVFQPIIIHNYDVPPVSLFLWADCFSLRSKSSNIGKTTTTNQCRRVPDLWRPGSVTIKRHLQEGQTKYTSSATKEERRINDNLNCKSKNLISYLIECKKCTKQYIGETKRQLHECFGEHRRSIQNHHQLIKPTPVSTHFNQPGHSIDHLF